MSGLAIACEMIASIATSMGSPDASCAIAYEPGSLLCASSILVVREARAMPTLRLKDLGRMVVSTEPICAKRSHADKGG